MKKDAARSIHTGRESAGFFHWADIMRKMDHYFLQIDECRKKSRGKMKVKKWLGIENLKTYETYISRWHEFLNKSEDGMKELDEQNQKVLTLLILQRFYQTPFQAKEDEEFYREFFERLSSVNEILGF